MKYVIKIDGIDCANCARELEEELEKIEGVASANVDFMAQKVLCDCDGDTLKKVENACNNFEEVKVISVSGGETDKKSEPEEPKSRVYGEKIRISGLCCANCGRELEEDLNKIEGVAATVDFMNMTVVLDADSPEAREKAVYTITHFEDVKIVSGKGERKSLVKSKLKDIICISVATALFIPAFIIDLCHLPEYSSLRIVMYCMLAVAYVLVGHGVLINTVKNIAKGKIFDENFLMTVASIGAITLGILTGDGFAEGVAVMLLYQIGEFLQSVAVGASRNSITDLMDLTSPTATLIENGEQRTVSPDELRAGDTILIKVGERVPVDCRILRGESSLDMKSLNGEPLPRNVKEGDEILSGSINLSRVLEARVMREYKDSAVAKILELVENSTAKKSKPEKFITKFARYYTPAVCIAAAVVAGIVPTIICAVNGVFKSSIYIDWIYKALNFLVISCPCALVISVPLSYFGGIGRCAKSGILVKGSTCLDELALAKVAAFDKTGTLTEGSFRIVRRSGGDAAELAAAAEKFSSHPIAAAFAGVVTRYVAENAEEIAGMGVKCTVNGKSLLVGGARLLRENGVEFTEAESLSTVVYVAHGGKFIGYVEIDDALKSGAAESIAELKKSGVEYTEMLTGDLPARAEEIARQAGLDGVKAALLPDMKLQEAVELKKRGKLLYVGDGINDAPVMTAADCAVSMGKVGSDAAIEASDIVLVSDSLRLLPKARRIARGTRRIVVQNIVGSLLVKAAIMALSIAVPNFPLIVSVIADVGVMLVAVFNAMRINIMKY